METVLLCPYLRDNLVKVVAWSEDRKKCENPNRFGQLWLFRGLRENVNIWKNLLGKGSGMFEGGEG